MRQGFTLVELSIVLVIIGLLIGGILAAQSLITTARIGAQVRQIQQIDVLVDNFQMRYNALPGDSTIFYMSGNNNGIYEDARLGTQLGYQFSGEIANFWTSLQAGGIMPSNSATYTESIPMDGITSSGSSPNTLAAAMKSETTGREVSIMPDVTNIGTGGLVHVYLFADLSATNSAGFVITPTNAYKCSSILAIDSKMDDGVLDAGNVQISDDFQYQFNGALDGNLSNCEPEFQGGSGTGQSMIVKMQRDTGAASHL